MTALASILLLQSYTIPLIIAGCVIIILSALYNKAAQKFNIPSVLLLIGTGILIKLGIDMWAGAGWIDGHLNLMPVLEVLGTVGLIMIVLEAALDLKLRRDKWGLIWKGLVVALLLLVVCTFAFAAIFYFLMDGMRTKGGYSCLVHAVPLAIISSAIVLPSVSSLSEHKKEFLIYEATFSDILGIMLFYNLVDNYNAPETGKLITQISGSIGLTIVVSLVLSYAIIWAFQRIDSHVKFFLMIAVVVLFYAVGKTFHLSSLIMVLIFGLMFSNPKIFFRGFLKKWFPVENLERVYENLHLITLESAFVVRTFFFVIFGMTIVLGSLLGFDVLIISPLIIAVIYATRWITLRIFLGKDIMPDLYIAPRGLITVLLFFAIAPTVFHAEAFESGVLLFVILASSLIMMFALIGDKSKRHAAMEQETARKAHKHAEVTIPISSEDDNEMYWTPSVDDSDEAPASAPPTTSAQMEEGTPSDPPSEGKPPEPPNPSEPPSTAPGPSKW